MKKILIFLVIFIGAGLSAHGADKVNIKGEYSPSTGELKVLATFEQIDIAEFSPYIKDLGLEGTIIENAQFKISGKDKYRLEAELELNYKGTSFGLRLSLADLTLPQINASLDAGAFNINLTAEYKPNKLELNEMVFICANTKIIAGANIDLVKAEGEVKGQGNVFLEDLMMLMDFFNLDYPALVNLKPQGKLFTQFSADTPWQADKREIKLKAKSRLLNIYDLDLEDLTIELYGKGNVLTISPIQGTTAGGRFDLRLEADFLDQKISAGLLLNDINLSYLAAQLGLESENLAGLLSLEADILNHSLSGFDKMQGEGRVSVSEGNIWEIDFLKGLGKFLFIPNFTSVVFKEGYSDLVFKANEVIFENAELKAQEMVLSGAGKMSLKGDIQFFLFPQFSPAIVSNSESLRRITTNILGRGGLVIEVSGTVKEPSYKMSSSFVSPMNKVKDFFENLLAQ